MNKVLRIGTRDSQLAVWQATSVQQQLHAQGIQTELVYIKSDGDLDLVTPLYEIGVQGIFTKTLDAALLSNRVDIAVHSMKDVPTQPARGIVQTAVLPRASYKDILVYKDETVLHRLGYDGTWAVTTGQAPSFCTIATSSIRRRAQWLNRYPLHRMENMRGNVNTRLQKVNDHPWDGAIFAAAGLERIGARPSASVELDWMLPAPAQGAIMVVCRDNDLHAQNACSTLHDDTAAQCVTMERDFLRALSGGCSTPISALAIRDHETIFFEGNILSVDGKEKLHVSLQAPVDDSKNLGIQAAATLLKQGADKMVTAIRHAGK